MSEHTYFSGHLSTETLAEYAEGLLGAPEAAQAHAHLQECDDCQAEELLLASLSDLLAADDVGPMPAHYAARIDAALAEVAMETGRAAPGPPVPGDAGSRSGAAAAGAAGTDAAADVTPGEGAQVIDLASRRRLVVTGFRRVSTVAASVVLLIGGAALGMEALNSNDVVDPGPIAIGPSVDFTSLPKYLNESLTAPANAVKGKNGSKVDPETGAVYKKDGEILLSDGRRVIPDRNGGKPKIVVPPEVKAQPENDVDPGGGPDPNDGGTNEGKPDVTNPGSKADAGRSTAQEPGPRPAVPDPADKPDTEAQEPAAEKSPFATQGPVVTPRAAETDQNQQGIASAQDTQPRNDEPYITVTNNTYDENNFASQVRELLVLADEYYQESSAEAPAEPADPSPPVETVAPDTASSKVAISQASSAGSSRGDAPEDVQQRIRRCANHLNSTLIAGDVGFWQGERAYIVVVPRPQDQNQVEGYVFTGADACTADNRASADSAVWLQTVDKPGGGPAARDEATRSLAR